MLSGATTGRIYTATARVQGITATDEGQWLFVLTIIPRPQPRIDKDTSNFYTLILNTDTFTALKYRLSSRYMDLGKNKGGDEKNIIKTFLVLLFILYYESD